jgi:hypothetical protein
VAEEIIAVRLIEEATDRLLKSRCEDGQLSKQEASAAIDELRGLFELFKTMTCWRCSTRASLRMPHSQGTSRLAA